MIILSLLAGFLLCYLTYGREMKSQCNREREDSRKIINEFSIRTGGRVVFKPERESESDVDSPPDEQRLLTPSMAEVEEEERYQVIDDLPEMTAADWAHLKESGVVR
jgi:hypothetical protein